jgi:antitoxin component YwqK of YwqJK toxin-antitoxin module
MQIYFKILAGILLLIISCKTYKNTTKEDNKSGISKEFYSNGKIKTETESVNGKANGLMKNYNPDGNLETVYTFRDGKRQGPSVEYYPDGKLRMKLFYKDNKKEGMAIWYYKSGKIFREIPYKEGKIDGIKKSYYEDGKLMAEAPYFNDFPGIDLKEYNSKGILLKNETHIEIKEMNRPVANGTLYLELTLSDSHPGISLFHGELMQGKYLSNELWPLQYKDGKFKYTIPLSSAGAKMEPIIFIASFQTNNSNIRVITRKYTPVVVNK